MKPTLQTILTSPLYLAFLFCLVLGLGGRLFLLLYLPAWHDEIYSVWVISKPWRPILSGFTDPVHTPGYYLLIKLLSYFSTHLYLLRSLSLTFFLLNCFLIYQICRSQLHRRFSLYAVCFYLLSGYFVIFDWQVRMYTVSLTAILISFFLYLKILACPSNKTYLLFTVVNVLGLFLDYAYLWYLIPLALALTYQSLRFHQHRLLLLSIFISFITFFLIFPNIFHYIQTGLDGILWMKPYTKIKYALPYFSGNFLPPPFALTLSIICLFPFCYLFFKRQPTFLVSLIHLSIISLLITLTYSLIFQPLFHLRSLQIIPLALLLCFSFVAYQTKKIHPFAPYAILFLQALLFIQSIYIIIASPGRVLLQFTQWKTVAHSFQYKHLSHVLYFESNKSPSPMLAYSLRYTLSGKESFNQKAYSVTKINSNYPIPPQCIKKYVDYITSYWCLN